MSERNLLMIPGPIEFEPAVLRALGEKTRSHLDPVFMKAFSRVLKNLRVVFNAPSAQPFVVAGSGTLAMEMAVANLVQPGDKALVVNTGYFSDRIATMLERHGAAVTQVKVPPGDAPPVSEVERVLSTGGFKLMTVTHVDTSTAVLAPLREYAEAAKKFGVMVVADGVCSVGGEALDMEAWGVDVAFTASQKALGTPPGLAVLLASPRAMTAWKTRTRPVAAMYLDFAEWLPVHEAYEAEKPAYFATPPVNLITALDVSLQQIVAETMPVRVARHVAIAMELRSTWKRLGLAMVPKTEGIAAHTLSALYYPQGVDAALVKALSELGITVAGGLHPEIKTKYFRVGHMGAVNRNDVAAVATAIERALKR
jgi:alanine-glyoxylate transaminase/serine-glyoxylate transaminase/serine-pyruvate transaminase